MTSTVDGKTLTISLKRASPINVLTGIIVTCIDTQGCLNYSGNNAYVKLYLLGQYRQIYGSGTPSAVYNGVVPFVQLQLNKPDYTPVSAISSEPLLT